ncbi:MAG: methyltransferase domain-containing protein [Deltaproteobacteria bacterium]|nr:MAG: methyltransferase domain-containing protein [Deltaproteobacteria bacterium]
MHRRLLDLLICPRCLPAEKPLRATLREVRGDEVTAATLECPRCRVAYPVDDGLAVLLPADGPEDRYASADRLAGYLWSHYADLDGDPDAHRAFTAWGELLAGAAGPVLDAGCAVGRLSFELARQAELVIGIDRSAGFVRTARALARDGRCGFELASEGELCETRTVRLPADLRRERVEFLVADALALPFPAGLFGTAASLNLIDRVPLPRLHLAELDRVSRKREAALLLADPWSWAAGPAAPDEWLGGRRSGPGAGCGRDNVRRLLERYGRPAWQVAGSGRIGWSIRHHRNHFELIYSDYLLARR